MIPVWKFYQGAWERRDNSWNGSTFTERIGQAFFNHLASVRPDLSEQIRGSDKDPFHIAYESQQWMRFIQFIQKNWDKKDSN